MTDRALAILLLLALAARALANGGGVILTPPADFTEIAPGSVKTILPGMIVRHAIQEAGEVWAATEHGVAHRAKGATGWTWPEKRPAMRVARFERATWAALANGGLVRLPDAAPKADPPLLAGEEVVDLAVAGAKLYALTRSALLVHAGARFVPVSTAGDAPRGKVTAISTGFDGKLYAGTDQTDIGVLDGNRWARYGFPGRVIGRVVRCVAPAVGHIWFGTFGSLNVYTPATQRLDDETAEKSILFPTRIMLSLAGDDERMLIVTGGGGLYRFERARTRWRLYADGSGLPSTSLETVTLSGTTALVATAAGLAQLDLALPLPADLREAASPSASPSPSPTATASASPTSPVAAVASGGADDGADAVAKLPPPATSLASTGRALLGTPSLLAPHPFTCLTCHRGLHGNARFTSPTGPAGTVDLTSAFTAPGSDDGKANPRRIPGLHGLKYRYPYPSSGVTHSLREYLRMHVVRDFEAAEPSAAVLDALEAYLVGLEVPSTRDLRPDGELAGYSTGGVVRGALLFRKSLEGLGDRSCASCHVPAQHFTDNALHLRPDGRWVRTPSLLCNARSAPYFADGSQKSLADVVAYYNSAYHLLLRQDERADLAAYLATVGEVAGP